MALWCLGCCGLFGSSPYGADGEGSHGPSEHRLQNTLLIRPEAPFVAEPRENQGGELGSGRGRDALNLDSSAGSFSSLEPVSPRSPDLLSSGVRGREGERELVGIEGQEASAGGFLSRHRGEASVSESSRLLGRDHRDSQATASGSNRSSRAERQRERQEEKQQRRRERRREKQRRRGRGAGEGGDGEEGAAARHGTLPEDEDDSDLASEKRAALKRFKTKTLDECPICLEPFSRESPAVFLNCGHAFHLHCVYEVSETLNVSLFLFSQNPRTSAALSPHKGEHSVTD